MLNLLLTGNIWWVWEFKSEIMSAEQYNVGHCFPCRKRGSHNRNKMSTFLYVCSVVHVGGGSVEKTFQKKNETLEIDVSTVTMILFILLSLCINLWPLHTKVDDTDSMKEMFQITLISWIYMAYLDAIGRISGVTVLNHCVNTYEPASQQGTTDKREVGRNFVYMYIWRSSHRTRIFSLK
jgi:hypothetical protein